ncbi:hypothetical protein PP713_13835 [Mycobacterium sp. CSUR Q5927]|nr:hypothetical protein [Mycobacterium sp. CSUR Q5927]
MTTSHLVHTERNSSYALTLGPLSTVVGHAGQDRERQIEIRWQCTRLDMGRDAALELYERLGDVLGVAQIERAALERLGVEMVEKAS